MIAISPWRVGGVLTTFATALCLVVIFLSWRMSHLRSEAYIQLQNLGAEVVGSSERVERIWFPGKIAKDGVDTLEKKDVDLLPHLAPIEEFDLSGVSVSEDALEFVRVYCQTVRQTAL